MKVLFMGAGHMACAVALGLKDPSLDFYIFTPSGIRAQQLATKTNGVCSQSISDIPVDIDVFVLGMKPQQLAQFSKEIGDRTRNKYIVSLLASVSVEKIEQMLGSQKVVRFMANTPARYGAGHTLLYYSQSLDEEFKDRMRSWAQDLGSFTEVDSDKMLNELTVFTASGPGYIFEIASYFEDKIRSIGVDEKSARQLVNSLFSGSASLMGHSEEKLSELVDQVTSKGGITIAAIEKFRNANMKGIISEGVNSALKRSAELEKQ